MDAFRAHLYGSGLSTRVVERDVATVTAFAEDFLLDRPEPRSLRQFGADDVRAYVARVGAMAELPEGRRRQILTGLKRFFRFLQDTGRMDYDAVDHALDVLKGVA